MVASNLFWAWWCPLILLQFIHWWELGLWCSFCRSIGLGGGSSAGWRGLFGWQPAALARGKPMPRAAPPALRAVFCGDPASGEELADWSNETALA